MSNMKQSLELVGAESDLRLRVRAEAFERYASLLLQQVEALDREDLATYERLAGDRDVLAGNIDALDTVISLPPDRPATLDGDADPHAVEVRIAAALERCARDDARLQLRLHAMRDAALAATVALKRGRGAALAYAGGNRPGTSFDVDL